MMKYSSSLIDPALAERIIWARFTLPPQSNIVTPATMTYISNTTSQFRSSNLPASSNRYLRDIGSLAFHEFNMGNFEGAETLSLEWLSEQGETAECYVLLATISMKFHKLDQANQYSDKAMSLNVSIPEPYIFKGLIYKEKGHIAEAINYFRIAIQIRPDHPDAYLGIANCYLALNDLENGINFCLLALQKQPDSLTARMELANMLKLAGRFEDAKKFYEQVIEKKPDLGLAWMSLGQIHSSLGCTWLALHHYEKAIQVDPYTLDGYLAFGNLLKDNKLYDKAMRVYLKGLAVFPTNPLLYGSLAGLYFEQGLVDLSIETYKHALLLLPNYPDAYCNLANAYKEKGLVKEAEQFYNVAINLCPTHADSYNNLANIYREQGKVKESLDLYRKALEINPHFSAAHSNIATVLQQCGNLIEAIFHYQRAVNSNPANPECHCFLGNALKEVGNYKGAVECYLRAIQLNPSSPETHAFLGTAYKESGSIVEGIQAFKISLKFRPDFNEVYCNLIHSYLLICEWNNYDEKMNKIVAIISEQLDNNRPPTVHPHHTMLYPLTPKQRKDIANRHALFCSDRVKFLGLKVKKHQDAKREKGQRIKLGYVSSDFCNHPTSHLIQSIPGLHDKKKFEVYCYSLIPGDDSSFRKKIEREVEHFIDISSITNVGEIADMISDHGIQILLNLNGYTKGARNEIFALKPAPIQIMYLGYPSTSGSNYMDYIITDKVTSPIEHEEHYSEKFAYMPNSFFIGDHARMFPHVLRDLTSHGSITTIVSGCNQKSPIFSQHCNDISNLSYIRDRKTLNQYVDLHLKQRNEETLKCKNSGERIPEMTEWMLDRKILGILRENFVFCNFNQLYKLDPNTFSCWCRILNRVPNSVLWLLKFPKFGESNLREYAKIHGVPQSKIIFTDVAGKEEHVRRGQIADICLDTPICNGHTTGMDVLWAGCPIVTMPLNSFASRVGSSIMTAIGCEELVVNTFKEYEEISVKLAIDKE